LNDERGIGFQPMILKAIGRMPMPPQKQNPGDALSLRLPVLNFAGNYSCG
jgi:hypothetical protein